ncbi:MAG: hypothetical protein K1X61_12635 [Chitinophagales bacterium]|nr:hypothetical protein [Chitinophagales bacterium]
MMILSVILLLFSKPSANPDLVYLRSLFVSAAADESKAAQLIEETQDEQWNPVLKAYCGAGNILMANHFYNPLKKFDSFNEGKALLESAIVADGQNPELRYLRLTIQYNAPAFLGYNKNIAMDKQYLEECLPKIEDQQLKTMIKQFLSSM